MDDLQPHVQIVLTQLLARKNQLEPFRGEQCGRPRALTRLFPMRRREQGGTGEVVAQATQRLVPRLEQLALLARLERQGHTDSAHTLYSSSAQTAFSFVSELLHPRSGGSSNRGHGKRRGR